MKTRFALATLVAFATPAVAMAAESGSGKASGGIMDSPIIPNLGEFAVMLVAFLVLMFVLNKFAWPMIIKALDDRADNIEGSLKKAEEAKFEAENILVEYKAKLTDAHKEAASIVEAGRKAGEVARESVIAKANEDAAAITARAQAAIEAERRSAGAELEAKVAEFSVAIAGKLIGEKLSANQDAQLIDRYLSEMGSFNDN